MSSLSLKELRQEAEWRRCASDEVYFLETYWKIRHPAKGLIPFEPRDAQRHALGEWADHRFSLTLKARQIGWSTLVAAHQFWKAFFTADFLVIDLSRTEREAISLLKKTKTGYAHLPEWMRVRGPKLLVDNQQKMSFSNGSEILSMPSQSDPARGESASLIVVDEWAFLENPEEAWASIEPVADVGGRIIGLSTANGSGNFFHQLWVGATTGNNLFSTMFFPWSAGDRDRAWYEEKKRSMLPWQLAQEYPTTPEEAFIRSGNPIFDHDALDRHEITTPLNGRLVNLQPDAKLPNWDFRAVTDPRVVAGSRGPLDVWKRPEPNTSYVLGVDTAEGLEHGDASSIHVLEVPTGDLVAHWHGRIPADELALEVANLGWWYNTALVGVERNNHGGTVLSEMRHLHYPRLFRRRNINTVKSGPLHEYGWETNRATKPILIDGLGKALKQLDVHVHCERTMAELRTYVREATGSSVKMHGSPHDDRVMSLAIANVMLEYAFAPEFTEKKDDYMTLAWWSRMADEADAAEVDRGFIGANSVRRAAYTSH